TLGKRHVSPRCSAPLLIVFGGHRDEKASGETLHLPLRRYSGVAQTPPVLLPFSCSETTLGRQGE
ncbi:hypothetical protein JOQ06_014067, partial [Pogonophryne albipinna]